MPASINFNHEALGSGIEIADEGAEERHLSPEHDAELARGNGRPQGGFGGVHMRAHLGSATSQKRRTSETLTTTAHDKLLGPALRRAQAHIAQTL